MIQISVNNKRFKGVYTWSDITLQKFCDLAAIPMPEGYEDFILAEGNYTPETADKTADSLATLTDEQVNDLFPEYYKKVIQCLSNIPAETIDTISTDDINALYEYYFKPFVVSLFFHVPVINFMGEVKQYQPEMIKKIRIGLQTFRLPETLNIMGQEIPLAKEPIITYTEASDIFSGMKITKNDVKRLGLFMAIYCRKRGERYEELKTLERQSLFMKVPMSTVWSVFFYTVQRLKDSTAIIRLFGRLPKTVRETVLAARDYRSMAVAH
jgi:hypothetical protein